MSSRMRRIERDSAVERRARVLAATRTAQVDVLRHSKADLEAFGDAVDALARATTREEVAAASDRLCQLYVALRCMALGMEPPGS